MVSNIYYSEDHFNEIDSSLSGEILDAFFAEKYLNFSGLYLYINKKVIKEIIFVYIIKLTLIYCLYFLHYTFI